jgi:hypothetical protein
MKQEIVMRGQTASGLSETLEFSGIQIENKNMAYKLTEFEIYPSTSIGGATAELAATVTAAKTLEDPENPNFANEGLIGTAMFLINSSTGNPRHVTSIVNDTYKITQNLILAVIDTNAGSPMAVNWQCRFKAVKMSDAEMAANNFKQYMISDGS